MKIYYAPNTRAVRIVWLFEELGLPYEIERFKLGDASMRSPDYLKVHPMGRVPTLQGRRHDHLRIRRDRAVCAGEVRRGEDGAGGRRRRSFPPTCSGCITPRA